jgi:fimbrial chaperone protein
MLFFKFRGFLIALAVAVTLSSASAMTVAPMQLEMVSVGSRSHAQISVVNNSDKPLPVEAVIERLSLDEIGRQTTTPSDGEFLVMPPQALIRPGATQNFRVQWLGEPLLDQSQSFLFFVNQIPVKLPKTATGVQVVMSMGVMVNVAPPEGDPAMQILSTGIIKDKSGNRYPTITVLNTSNVHALLPQAAIQLSAGSWDQTLPPQSVSDGIGIGLVQPGKRRKFKLPVALPPSVTKVNASLQMTGRRVR